MRGGGCEGWWVRGVVGVRGGGCEGWWVWGMEMSPGQNAKMGQRHLLILMPTQ